MAEYRHWSDAAVIYEDEELALLWGKWKDNLQKDVGIRWVVSNYPQCRGGAAGWLVLPWNFALPILKEVLVSVARGEASGSTLEIADAIRELERRAAK